MTRLLCLLILIPLLLLLVLCEQVGWPYPRLGVSPDSTLDRLMTAIALTDGPAMRRVLASGRLDLRSRDRDHLTALTRAARGVWIDGCRMLLDHGADPNATDGFNLAPLHYVAFNGGPDAAELVELLIRRGADVNSAGQHRNTPLHHAAMFGRPEVVERLLRSGADVNAVADSGVTPLHNAAAAGDPEKVAILLNAGADPRARDASSETPLDAAHGAGAASVAKLLRAEQRKRLSGISRRLRILGRGSCLQFQKPGGSNG